jgi:hypothetical protein
MSLSTFCVNVSHSIQIPPVSTPWSLMSWTRVKHRYDRKNFVANQLLQLWDFHSAANYKRYSIYLSPRLGSSSIEMGVALTLAFVP